MPFKPQVGTSCAWYEAQLVALEKAKAYKATHGEFESEHRGHCVAQDTFYGGTLKGVGRMYQQTAIDTSPQVGFATLASELLERHSFRSQARGADGGIPIHLGLLQTDQAPLGPGLPIAHRLRSQGHG